LTIDQIRAAAQDFSENVLAQTRDDSSCGLLSAVVPIDVLDLPVKWPQDFVYLLGPLLLDELV
jgi:hypothetical protein